MLFSSPAVSVQATAAPSMLLCCICRHMRDCSKLVAGGDDAAGFAPSFIEKPRIIPNETGTLITMRCKCKANPKPVVTWYRGTTLVKETTKIKIKTLDKEEDVYELLLEIKVGSKKKTVCICV